MYIKTAYKRDAVFSQSKIVYTIGENTFNDSLGKDFTQLANIHANIKDKDLEPFKEADNAAMFRGGAMYADAITFGSDNVDKNLLAEFTKVKGKKIIPFTDWTGDLTPYLDLYNELAAK
jgi:starch synthase